MRRICLSAACAAAVAFGAFGETKAFSPTGEDDSAALQALIDAAAAGDTISLVAGTYKINQTVYVTNDVTLAGATGDWKDVIVDGENKCRVFELKNPSGNLSNLTVTRGYDKAKDATQKDMGGGAYVVAGNITGCRFYKCQVPTVGKGGALYMTGGTVDGCVIDGTTYAGTGLYGAIYINGASAVVRNSVITNNVKSSTRGNGWNMAAFNMDNGLIENCLIADNSCGSLDATSFQAANAIYMKNGTVRHCSIVRNNSTGNDSVAYKVAAVAKDGGYIYDTLIYDNLDRDGRSIDLGGNSKNNVNNCCLGSATGVTGEDTFAADPLYYLVNGVFGYHPGSPCIEPGIGLPNSYNPGAADCCFVACGSTAGIEPLEVALQAYADGSELPDGFRYRWTFAPAVGDAIVDTVTTANYEKSLMSGRYSVTLEIVDGNGVPCCSFVRRDLISIGKSEYHPLNSAELVEAVNGQADGAKIYLAANTTYAIDATLVLSKNVSIIGADRDTTVVDGQNKCRVFKVEGETGPNAIIANLTIRRGSGGGNDGGNGSTLASNPGGGGVLLFKGGMLTNCVVEACTGANCTGANGVHVIGGKVVDTIIRNLSQTQAAIWGQALIADGGALVDHCVISNCTAKNLTPGVYPGPLDVYGTGTELRNCLITDCRYSYYGTASADHAMAVYLRSGTPKLVNCTITGNTMDAERGAAVVAAAGTIKNCIIAGNYRNLDSGTPVESNISGSPAVSYTASRPAPTGTGNKAAPDALFKAGTFELVPGSALIGSGDVTGEDWMINGKDLKGIDRLRDGKVDMGAFAYVPPALACSIEYDGALTVRDSIDATLAAHVEGSSDGLVYAWTMNGVPVTGAETCRLVLDDYGSFEVLLHVRNQSGDEATSEPMTFKIVPSTVYVDATSEDPVVPYGDPDHAARDPQDAIDLVIEGCTVIVKPGTYTLAKTLKVNLPITIRASGDRDNTVFYVGGNYEGVQLNVSGVTFSGVTVTNGYATSASGGGDLYASAGTTVEACRFSGARYNGSIIPYGIALRVVDATVRDCQIVNNLTSYDPGTRGQLFYGAMAVSGDNALAERCLIADNSHLEARRDPEYQLVAGLHLSSGTVRNCLIRNNQITDTDFDPFGKIKYMRAGGVVVKGGVLENCTVVGNRSELAANGVNFAPAGVYADGGTVRNCIVWDNVHSGEGVANWGGTEAKFTYCCTMPALADVHSISSDPRFRNPAALDGTLRAVSPCARTGLFSASWMTDALDFYGKPMAYGTNKNRVGMGCSAVPVASGLTIFIQ